MQCNTLSISRGGVSEAASILEISENMKKSSKIEYVYFDMGRRITTTSGNHDPLRSNVLWQSIEPLFGFLSELVLNM